MGIMHRIILALVFYITACTFNEPPNTKITTIDSFPQPDSLVLIQEIRESRAAVVGKIVKVERDERYEDMCSLVCHLKGGSEPNRFYYAKIVIDSAVAKDGSDVWVAWGIPPKDWMPGKGLTALFLIRQHCWEDFDLERAARGQVGSYYKCDTMWSIGNREDIMPVSAFGFIRRHVNLFGINPE
jgi:hypothetical protein